MPSQKTLNLYLTRKEVTTVGDFGKTKQKKREKQWEWERGGGWRERSKEKRKRGRGTQQDTNVPCDSFICISIRNPVWMEPKCFLLIETFGRKGKIKNFCFHIFLLNCSIVFNNFESSYKIWLQLRPWNMKSLHCKGEVETTKGFFYVNWPFDFSRLKEIGSFRL